MGMGILHSGFSSLYFGRLCTTASHVYVQDVTWVSSIGLWVCCLVPISITPLYRNDAHPPSCSAPVPPPTRVLTYDHTKRRPGTVHRIDIDDNYDTGVHVCAGDVTYLDGVS